MTRSLPAAAVLALTASCASPRPLPALAPAAAPQAIAARDVHSYGNPAEARVTDVALDLVADFDAQRLAGTATLTLDVSPGARRIVLDTSALAVDAVTDAAGRPLSFALGEEDAILGRPLAIELPAGATTITVRYATTTRSSALQWLRPEQTAGKRRPFLLSQGQAIRTRSWIPTQDSPGVRQTYAARITVPAGLRAVMSAEALTPAGVPVAGGTAFEFRMREPVPPYLVALAVGDLGFRAMGPRTGVYAEPEVLARAADELADLERMLDAAEGLYGPYRWGRYDVLVLPPSFPFGGMENPRVTFLSPTVIAGDRSLVAVVAHELAHSWSGNLVCNATWRDFWLNEGFTTYIERRIVEVLYGADVARLLQQIGLRDLRAELAELGPGERWRSVLAIDLAGRDPDEGISSVPYDKGAALLSHVERVVGRARFDAFLRGYFDRHAFQAMTTEAFLADARTHLAEGDEALWKRLALDAWVHGEGLPDDVAPPSERAARAEAAARVFAEGAAATALSTRGWVSQEWVLFLDALASPQPPARLAELDRAFGFTERGNAEVHRVWFRHVIASRYEPALPALERHLVGTGRVWLVRDLYAQLAKTDWGLPLARRIFERARPGYHPATIAAVERALRGEPR